MNQAHEEAPPSAAVSDPDAASREARPVRRRRPPQADPALQRQQQALAEALELAQSIDYQAQPAIPPELLPRGKAGKARKAERVRGRYEFSPAEYRRLSELKAQLRRFGLKARRNDLLRAGLLLLGALNDAELKAVMLRVEGVRKGKPARDCPPGDT